MNGASDPRKPPATPPEGDSRPSAPDPAPQPASLQADAGLGPDARESARTTDPITDTGEPASLWAVPVREPANDVKAADLREVLALGAVASQQIAPCSR